MVILPQPAPRQGPRREDVLNRRKWGLNCVHIYTSPQCLLPPQRLSHHGPSGRVEFEGPWSHHGSLVAKPDHCRTTKEQVHVDNHTVETNIKPAFLVGQLAPSVDKTPYDEFVALYANNESCCYTLSANTIVSGNIIKVPSQGFCRYLSNPQHAK